MSTAILNAITLGGDEYVFALPWEGAILPDNTIAVDTETEPIRDHEIPRLALAGLFVQSLLLLPIPVFQGWVLDALLASGEFGEQPCRVGEGQVPDILLQPRGAQPGVTERSGIGLDPLGFGGGGDRRKTLKAALEKAETEAHDSSLARQLYVNATVLYPDAQSPRLALSALAARERNQAGAVAAMSSVLAIPGDQRADPWWHYQTSAGRDAPAFAATLSAHHVPHEIVGTLETAVPASLAAAQATRTPVILLSPAAASFDQFGGFDARGQRFATLVSGLARGEAA